MLNLIIVTENIYLYKLLKGLWIYSLNVYLNSTQPDTTFIPSEFETAVKNELYYKILERLIETRVRNETIVI